MCPVASTLAAEHVQQGPRRPDRREDAGPHPATPKPGEHQLTSFYIDPELCKACLICGRNCPSEAIIGAKKQIHYIDQDKCNGCGTCLDVCPPKFNAVKKISGEPVPAPLPEEQRSC